MADQVVLFQDADFRGGHRHVFDAEADLNAGDDSGFNDAVSSLVILSGNWRFFRDANFQDPYPPVLGPGLYPFVGTFQIATDDMSSLQATDDPATLTGAPLTAHAILFEHVRFHGAHRHLFAPEGDLDQNDFNDATSSVVVEAGQWQLFQNANFDGDFGVVLGVGVYLDITALGENAPLSSLRPTALPATVSNTNDSEVLLFEHTTFRGAHKHVFIVEPDLAAPDDGSFNDLTSSIVVLRGTWQFFGDANFIDPFVKVLPPGTYADVVPGFRNDAISSLRILQDNPPMLGAGIDGHVILFEHRDFHGAHKHVFNLESSLSRSSGDSNDDDDSFFNDRVSSIVVLSGHWQFFRDIDFKVPYAPILGPGLYSFVGDVGIENDDLSSLRQVEQPVTAVGAVLAAHLVLHEHDNFHGAHKHVFGAEPDLNTPEDNFFNDKASSIIVHQGSWALFADANFRRAYPVRLGPGRYPSLTAVGITSDDLSSLVPGGERPTVFGAPLSNEILLFEHRARHGAHKHVYVRETDLGARDDATFNNITTSLAVLQGSWLVFSDPQLLHRYPPVLGGGLYDNVSDVGITNDDLSSLEPAGALLTFDGSVQFQVNNPLIHPKPQAISFPMQFFADDRSVEISGFPILLLGRIKSPILDTATAEFEGADLGTFAVDGTFLVTNVHFNVHESSNVLSDSQATLPLTTGTSSTPPFTLTGVQADASGNIVIVGTGTIVGGAVDGTVFAVTLTGTLTPRP